MQSYGAAANIGPDALIGRATRLSHYAQRLVSAEPGLALDTPVDRAFSTAAMRTALDVGEPADEERLKQALRTLRKRVMLNLIARDLGGTATLAEVIGTTTALAEVAIGCAVTRLDQLLCAQHGHPVADSGRRIQRFHVVGMGKLGGAELNVSSDIDLVFAYPEDGETTGPRSISNHEYFTRLGRKLIAVLSEMTTDGYVFRVDMRLRPYGDGGALAASFETLESYFTTQGREWERYAWIKGRVLTGDREAELDELVRPFVYRRHLDYNALGALRELHGQIRREVERRDIADNIKLGPGGIREIEFIVQLFQLIRGGRVAALRNRPTLAVLPVLGERNLLPARTVSELTEAYVFLRRLEHRLQYLDDQQTHSLPQSDADRALIAESMGLRDYDALARELEAHRARVTRHFQDVFAASPDAMHPLAYLWYGADDSLKASGELAALGYRQPQTIGERLKTMRTSPRYRAMPALGQARLDRLVPLAIDTAAAQRYPDATLERLLDLLEAVSGRVSYLALLEEYPRALKQLAAMMSASPWVAQYLTRHPILLDELLDTRTLYAAPDWPAATRRLEAELAEAAGDTEKQMDVLRHFKHVHTLRFIAQDLGGLLPLETLSDYLSDLACVILQQVLRLAWKSVRQAHRAGPRFAVIGYGKLGGKELGYASDLDVVFLYDDTAAEAAENYARLGQRVNNWLTTVTSAGVLYETDLRLRPDGAGGLLVSPLESFREYQASHAWTWEHQALSRARYVAGDTAIGNEFEALRVTVLRQPRDLVALRRQVAEMRRKLLDGHPNRSALFDLKHDRGGIIDVEFVVQYLVLGHACRHAELTGNIGNLALLKLAARLELVDEQRALAAHEAYRHLRQMQHSLRLAGEKYARVAPETMLDQRHAVQELWESVMGPEGSL
ncbi:MAG TPA: bifunctional [glutamate--ammonia ligase]-adenylyl-L-tyrosine phosphorylase/[glutamate--ammonia-ligase] adenylyltransferase [Burkholderiales bacterium]|nr:bifunctional [glutamate--ammonia ligase]-adenylyl-L-tyrosine phosphorylase/[glutamate--ammonia-ligase] adenylyltransferase [Burkholderiales bacterium]